MLTKRNPETGHNATESQKTENPKQRKKKQTESVHKRRKKKSENQTGPSNRHKQKIQENWEWELKLDPEEVINHLKTAKENPNQIAGEDILRFSGHGGSVR